MIPYRFISIEGNIGAGKTTLSQKLAEHLPARLLLERFADNSFLPKFYEDPERYAFPLELSFMADRFKQIQEEFQQYSLFGERIVSDYIFAKSLLFASNNLQADEFDLYRNLFHIIHPNLPQPEIILFLYAPVELLLKNIQKRGRSYEQNIQAEYLQNIQQKYTDYLKNHEHSPVLMIDTSRLDFVGKEDHFQYLIQLLGKEYSKGLHFPEMP